jgi:glycosyltransferase involved in cell wall biosynthesis
VLRNGVDLERFRLLDRDRARSDLGIGSRPTLLSVGYLIERKGHHLVIEALAQLPDHQLLIVGGGPERMALELLAARLGVDDRVRFVGVVPQHLLPSYYNAADILVLASSREGWANVLLESMACGTPVVATSIWGTPEVVADPVAGRLASERSAAALVAAVVELSSAMPSRLQVRRYAEQFSWSDTTNGQLELFNSIVRRNSVGAMFKDTHIAQA